jgi:very-short-patch-repair endonuclease
VFDAAVADLAKRQYGLFSRAQVKRLEGSDIMIWRRVEAGKWTHETEGVYGLPGWPESWWREVWRAYLATGPDKHVAVSHETAAAIHRMSNFPRGRIVLTTKHGDHHWHGLADMRQSTDLKPEHVRIRDGLPVTTPVRTLFDLAAVAGRERLAVAIEDAHITKQCRLEELIALYEELRRPGKHGMKKLGRILAERGPGYVPPESKLERMLLKILRDAGLPKPRLQVQLPWRTTLQSRCDALYEKERIILEADGRRWHTRVDTMAEDRRRDREAQNHGYRSYRFVYEELKHDPKMVVDTIVEARAA